MNSNLIGEATLKRMLDRLNQKFGAFCQLEKGTLVPFLGKVKLIAPFFWSASGSENLQKYGVWGPRSHGYTKEAGYATPDSALDDECHPEYKQPALQVDLEMMSDGTMPLTQEEWQKMIRGAIGHREEWGWLSNRGPAKLSRNESGEIEISDSYGNVYC